MTPPTYRRKKSRVGLRRSPPLCTCRAKSLKISLNIYGQRKCHRPSTTYGQRNVDSPLLSTGKNAFQELPLYKRKMVLERGLRGTFGAVLSGMGFFILCNL